MKVYQSCRPRLRILFVLGALVTGVSGLAHADTVLITNPSFEDDGDFASPGYIGGTNGFITGWTTSSASAGVNTVAGPFYGPPNGSTPDGTHVGFAQGPMTFRTRPSTPVTGFTIGQTYLLFYSEALRFGNTPILDSLLEVDFGNDGSFEQVIVPNHTVANVPWAEIASIAFVATDTTAALQFTVSNNGTAGDATVLLDNVRITATIPEPSSIAMLALGSAALVSLARRRR